MSKFDNAYTTIKAVVVDIEAMTKNEVEYTNDSYVRSDKRAEAIIREALGIEENAIVKITGYVQHNTAPKAYNVRKMIHDGFEVTLFDACAENEIAVAIPMYAYFGNVFAENEETGELVAVHYAANVENVTPDKFTKGNARDYIKYRFEDDNEGFHVVAITHNTREEIEHFIVATPEKFAEYEL